MGKSDETSKEHFTKTASTYDSGFEGRWAAVLYESVLGKLEGSDWRHLLDIGCGPGTFLSRIPAIKRDMSISAIDLTPEMARIAKERLGSKADIRLCNICSEQVPWSENSFDRVICMSTFHHFTDPKKALSEMYRVTKPQGRVIIADITAFSPVRQLYNSVIFPLFKHGDVRIYSESELRRLLTECGFQSVSWERTANPSPAFGGFVATGTPSK